MSMTDPIGDMLTRIRNASKARHQTVEMPASKMKTEIAGILKDEGYIVDFESAVANSHETLRLKLKYSLQRERAINGLRRISRPGLRVYAGKDEIPRVLGGLGIAIMSTSRGVITNRQAVKQGVGGEVLCYIW